MNVVHRLNSADKRNCMRWNEFIESCSNATFFHRSEWQAVLNNCFPHKTFFLYSVNDGSINGVLPLAQVKSTLFGNSLVSLPFAVYGGIAASSENAFETLEAAARQLAVRLKVDFLEFRNVEPHQLQWASQSLYYTFRRKIDKDVEANLAAIPRKQRAMVRKGTANGLISVVDRDTNSFYRLYADNMHRHGTPPLSKRFFETTLRVFGSAADILTVIDASGEPLSAVLSFYFKNEVLPYYAGDVRAARDVAANDFKYWELMRRATAQNIEIFDFGRSKQDTGSFHFKKNWGFEPRPLNYRYCLFKRDRVPQNNPSNKKFDVAIRAWRRLPLTVVNRLGPYLVRGLG